MEKNIGVIDRVVRFLAAALLIFLGYRYYPGYSLVLFFVAALLLLTVLTRYCWPYKLLRISTRKEAPKKKTKRKR